MRLSWDQYFMDMAYLSARRATCPRRQVGAVLVRQRQVLATGYNGSLAGSPHCTEVGCALDGQGHCRRTIHAEMNAIFQAAMLGIPIQGAMCYVTDTPCAECARALMRVGVHEVVVGRAYGSDPATELTDQGGTVRYLSQTPLPLIGLVGAAGSGKDTVADWLVDQGPYTKIAFADPLRSVVQSWFPGAARRRVLLQSLGDWGRQQDAAVFVDWVGRRVRRGGPWVVTDIRYLNELHAVQQWGGLVVGIDTDVAIRRDRVLQRDGDQGVQGWNHSSEQIQPVLDQCAFRLTNNGTREDLYAQCHQQFGSLWAAASRSSAGDGVGTRDV